MLTDLQKEIGIWGGSSLVLCLVIAYQTNAVAEDVSAKDTRAQQLYGTYSDLYLGEGNRRPAAEARQVIDQAAADQLAERQAVEVAVIGNLPPRIFQSDFSYVNAVAWAEVAHTELKNKASRLNIGALPALPYDGDQQLDKDDAIQRSVQLGRVYSYKRILDFLLDRNLLAVNRIVLSDIRADAASPSYAVLGLDVGVTADYATIDKIMRDLRNPDAKLHLRSFDMSPSGGADRFSAVLGIDLVVAWPPSWEADKLLKGATAASNARPGTSRGGRR